MDDLEALYAAICQAPCEDAPRLIYADALQERDQPGDSIRAEFIRKSIELSQLGSPRPVVDCGIPCWQTDRFCTMSVWGDECDVDVGQRIDVKGERIDEFNPRGRYEVFHGLLVTKITPDDESEFSGMVTLALKQDEYSVPFPRKKHAELTKFVFNELKKNWKEWFPDIIGVQWVRPVTHNGIFSLTTPRQPGNPQDGIPSWRFDRGFLAGATVTWSYWEDNAEVVLREVPITHVEFMDTPEWDYSDSGVVIAGQTLPWGASVSPGFGDSYDEWVEEKLTTFLSLRWPTIPPENWSIPD